MWHGVAVIQKPGLLPVDLQEVKHRLRIDAPDDDSLLTKLIKGAVARIDGPGGIGYAMMQQTWRKSFDCFPSTIYLPGAPVKSVVAIKYLDSDGIEQTLDPTDYRVDVLSEPVRVVPAYGLSWPTVRDVIGSVYVDYLLGEESDSAVEPDLIDAVCLLVGHRYENREAAVVGVSAGELPLSFNDIIRDHRRCAVAV